jgi:hypothetical protein
VKHINKSYWKIPGGEIQYGHISRSVVVWFRRKRYILRRGST